MVKRGIAFLFITFVQVILVIISYDFLNVYINKGINGAIPSSGINLVPQEIWNIIIFEFLISLVLIVYGAYKNYRARNKSK